VTRILKWSLPVLSEHLSTLCGSELPQKLPDYLFSDARMQARYLTLYAKLVIIEQGDRWHFFLFKNISLFLKQTIKMLRHLAYVIGAN
jgi:hypothetical protein